mgnify:CR=1 FL=1
MTGVQTCALPIWLATFHESIQTLGKRLESPDLKLIVDVLQAMADWVEKIVVGDVGNSVSVLDMIGTSVSAVQAVLCQGYDPQSVAFPPEVRPDSGVSCEASVRDAVAGTGSQMSSGRNSSGSDPSDAESVSVGGLEDSALQNDAFAGQGAGGAALEAGSGSHGGHAIQVKLPSNVDDKIFADFLARQPGNLEDIETQILNLETNDRSNAQGALLRAFHTLKGESALLGLSDVERLCHAAEDVQIGRASCRERV